ncbi:deacylase [bacterium]|nr:MAG: deacylase [bacterium]
MPCEKLLDFLHESGVDFEFIDHPRAYAAEEVARKAGVEDRSFVKTVLVRLDGLMAMALVPASFKVNFNLLREAAGATTITLALEHEFEERFPDCSLGAMPPFGNLYAMDVYADGSLTEVGTIAFNAGTHREVITMVWDDYEALVVPHLARFAYQALREERCAW